MSDRILLVDDDPNVLAALRNSLRRMRDRWVVVGATSGEEALALMQEEPFAVVVTDMRMPVMDGAELLERVRDLSPTTARIILSGYSELDAVRRTVTVAHQFLAKPTEPGTLEEAIQRALSLRELVADEAVLRIVGRVDRLPSAPRVFARLTAMLGDPDVSAADVATLIERDVAMSAKILQLVNSAFFRSARRISSVEGAVRHLGFATIQKLVLTLEVFASAGAIPVNGLSHEAIQDHALAASRLASRMPGDAEARDDAGVAALLCDVGLLLLAAEATSEFRAAWEQAAATQRPLHEVEREVHGTTHAEVGAYLLGLWGLPLAVVEAVANHHAPERIPREGMSVAAAVYFADTLAAEATGEGGPFWSRPPLDESLLAAASAGDEVAKWRGLADDLSLAGRS
ncbi:MAG: HDOD domain-containing protein [Gemmatimonadetes bacterium]|nr:MAG: HDOD domain-containing protein [Gemmatimonadota bacterium]